MDTQYIKKRLLLECREYVDRRIATAAQAMDQAQRSANEEGKNSAGDKYETGRAMMQIERDKAAAQLEEGLKLKAILDRINPEIRPERISLGSLVITSAFKIFVTIGIGKMNVEGEDFLVVAPSSPLGKVLMGLKTKEVFTFNSASNTIIQIL
jgi:hypothetical protein